MHESTGTWAKMATSLPEIGRPSTGIAVVAIGAAFYALGAGCVKPAEESGGPIVPVAAPIDVLRQAPTLTAFNAELAARGCTVEWQNLVDYPWPAGSGVMQIVGWMTCDEPWRGMVAAAVTPGGTVLGPWAGMRNEETWALEAVWLDGASAHRGSAADWRAARPARTAAALTEPGRATAAQTACTGAAYFATSIPGFSGEPTAPCAVSCGQCQGLMATGWAELAQVTASWVAGDVAGYWEGSAAVAGQLVGTTIELDGTDDEAVAAYQNDYWDQISTVANASAITNGWDPETMTVYTPVEGLFGCGNVNHLFESMCAARGNCGVDEVPVVWCTQPVFGFSAGDFPGGQRLCTDLPGIEDGQSCSLSTSTERWDCFCSRDGIAGVVAAGQPFSAVCRYPDGVSPDDAGAQAEWMIYQTYPRDCNACSGSSGSSACQRP